MSKILLVSFWPRARYRRWSQLVGFILATVFSSILAPAQMPSPASGNPAGDDVENINLPSNSINDVLSLYEMLTGKRTIRDGSLAGPNFTVVAPGKISKESAIAMIESALLLNGYTLIPVDASTVKVIGPARSPLGEGLPLYTDETSLPSGEQIVSYFMPLTYISAKDAKTIFDGYMTSHAQGPSGGGPTNGTYEIVPVPNSNAILITSDTPLLRRLIDLQHLVDVPGAKVVTEFVPLTRASADKVAETINKIIDEESKKTGAGDSSAQASSADAPGPAANGTMPEVLPDIRTNRVVLIGTESKVAYLKQLVSSLDEAVTFDTPLEWQLKFVPAGQVLPVLESILSEGDDTQNANPQAAATPPPQINPSANSYANTQSGETGSSNGDLGGEKPDKLQEPTEDTSPIAVSVGKVRIIADRSANKIIVIGPPESRARAASVLEMLDKRPKQIYLATVIGQLTLGSGLNLGITYPNSIHIGISTQGNNNAQNNISANSSAVSPSTINTSTSTTGLGDQTAGQLINSAIGLAGNGVSLFSGFALFGVLADSIDFYVSALASTNRFKIISRPVIYTANNKKAVISSGQEVPVPEETLTSANSVTTQGTQIASNIGYKDVVLKLEVIPLINSDNEVTLQIAQQNDSLSTSVQIGANSVPTINTQELTTTVTVPNRHTVVLGGLITDQEQTIKSGLPLLSNIPGIGYLFGQKTKQITRQELIIMIQPFIIDSEADEEDVSRIEKSMSSLEGQLYDQKPPVNRSKPAKKTSKPAATD